jgi:hypothetical protein
MKRLTQQGYERAKQFMRNEARPLENALFAFHFEDGSGDAVATALETFRNSDGGFGLGLEPDTQTPSSSPLATAYALRTLAEVEPDAEADLVRSAIDYLLKTLDPETLTWRPVAEDVNEYPHAPWWHDEGDKLAKTFDDFRVIPRALIVALLHHYAALVPPKMLATVTDSLAETIAELDVLGSGGGSDLQYFLYLAQVAGLPQPVRKLLVERLEQDVPHVVERDPKKWSTYCLTPLRAAPTPTSIGAVQIRALSETYLDWVIDHQTDEGCWNPTWTWFGEYPEIWPVAERQWKGILTLEHLLYLQAYERL